MRAVFDEVVLLDESARDAYLQEQCAADSQMQSEIRRLLAAYDEANTFLERPLNLAVERDEEDFAGTDRFRVLRRLGAGGMGVVYAARDQLRDEVVALKTLRRAGAADLYYLKREFRGLADVAHPNLVCLYELFVDDDRRFFTMELVNGVSFVEYARAPGTAPLDIDRLVDALGQLIDGVIALHRRGKLHRDIKPSNVLVTPEGRVVILDFGLLAEALPEPASESRYLRGGTPAYMAPEEVSGAAPSEASDWYGIGVTLFEALTGRLPFEGSPAEVLRLKQTADAPDPVPVAADIPAELSAICIGLLSRDPAERLKGPDARRRLLRDTNERLTDRASSTAHDTPFIGRQRELSALAAAARDAGDGRAMTVGVYGPSGIGKSAVVRRFLSQFVRQSQGVVLVGRCYENESVPFKALDGVIDDLSGYLASLPANEVAALLPADLSALTRVFPVLLQVEAVSVASRNRELDSLDPLRVRRRAFDALGVMLSRLASRRSLVVWIDDLQWADEDSILLLDELLGPARPQAMLTLLGFRSEELETKPFLQALLDRAGRDGWSALRLEPMPEDEAHALIECLLPAAPSLTEPDRQRMTREAGGSPLVLEQLALYAGANRGEAAAAPTFAAMFESRLSALPQEARHFLETLAICGRPVAPEIVCDACAIARDRQSLVVMLRASHLIRSSGSSARVETYHDRIREVLAGRIATDDGRRIHGRMVAALLARGSDDCDSLFEHYRGAGDLENASIQAGLAAEKASHALAFDRAAVFYAHALQLGNSSSADWQEALATALANAGRPAEAAEAYLQAAAGADHPRQVELRRRAAEQFLTGGHIDRGLDLIRSVLESVGLSLASSPQVSMARVVWRRARLALRGLRYTPRPAEEIDANTLLRLDTTWAVATGLGLVDVASGSDFIAWHLHAALDAGEPSRIARGLAIESSARNADWMFRPGASRLARLGADLANEIGTPQAQAITLLADSVSACAQGEWRRTLVSGEQALAILRDRCIGVTWELNMAQNMVIWGLMYLGEFGEVSRRLPVILADARRRGNLYLATELCTRCNIVWLMADDPDTGEREALAALANWSPKGFHRQHYSALLARAQTALYRGNSREAWRLMAEQEPKIRWSLLTRVQAFRVEINYLRGRCAVAMAASDGARGYLRYARTCARRIAREEMHWSTPISLLLQAGIASVEGRADAADAHLREAVARFDPAEMGLYAAVARRRLPAARRDAANLEEARRATEWMAAQQIKNPENLTRMLVPGVWDS